MDQQIDLPYPVTVFYSYAPEDESLRQELEKHLVALRRQGLIREWHAHKIGAGTDRTVTINKHLMAASVILLLISPDFLASDYHYGIEMQKALQREQTGDALVIPVLLRPVDLRGEPFEKLQCLPRNARPITLWNNQDEAFQSVASSIREMIERADSSQEEYDANTSSHSDVRNIKNYRPTRSQLAGEHIRVPVDMGRWQWWKFPLSVRSPISVALLVSLFLLVFSLLAYSQFNNDIAASPHNIRQNTSFLNIQYIDTVSEGILLPTKPEDYSPDKLSNPPIGVVQSYLVAQPPAILPTYHVILELMNQTDGRNVLTINQITLNIKQLSSMPSQLNIWKKVPAPMTYPALLYIAEHNSYQVGGAHIAAYPIDNEGPEFLLAPGASTRVDVGLRSTWPAALSFIVEVSYTTNNISYTASSQQMFQIIFTDSEENWHFYSPGNQGKFVPDVT